MKIGTKLGLGYALILILILMLQVNAVRDILVLTDLLETMRVEALGAMDNMDNMDAFVSDLQHEYIDSHKVMSEHQTKDPSKFRQSDRITEGHLEKLDDAIFLSKDQKEQLKKLHQDSISLRNQMFLIFNQYSVAKTDVVSTVREFVVFLSLVDERGEEEISELEIESDKQISWDSGLGSTWMRTIQPLELKIDILEHFDFVLRYLSGENPKRT